MCVCVWGGGGVTLKWPDGTDTLHSETDPQPQPVLTNKHSPATVACRGHHRLVLVVIEHKEWVCFSVCLLACSLAITNCGMQSEPSTCETWVRTSRAIGNQTNNSKGREALPAQCECSPRHTTTSSSLWRPFSRLCQSAETNLLTARHIKTFHDCTLVLRAQD